MEEERILALDVSSKTGWAFMLSKDEGLYLTDYGQLKAISEPEGKYPSNYIDWASTIFGKLLELIEKFTPSILVIEETCAGSKNVYSQKILEWTHFLLAKYIKKSKIKVKYLLTGEWRVIAGCKMTKEESQHNKKVKEYKTKNKTKIAYNENGKRVGRLTKKHINIRRANEIFSKFLAEPLRKKDEDKADALLLGFAFHQQRMDYERRKSLG